MAVNRPRSGPTPEAMAMAMDKGKATMATVRPATASARKFFSPAFFQDRDELRRIELGEGRAPPPSPQGS